MIWITSWGGLFYFDGKDFSSSTVSSPEPEEVSAGIYSPPYGERWQYADDVKDVVVTDRFGVKWHIKSSGKIFTISPDGREVEYTERPEFKGYRGCFIDRQSNVWILCYNELHKLVFSSYRTNYLTETIGESVRCMYSLKNGQHWLCQRDSKTILVYDRDCNFIGYLGKDGKITGDKTSFGAAIYSMTETKDGTIWLGSRRDGLFRLVPDKEGCFTVDHLSQHDSSSRNIYSIATDSRGRVWLAMFDGGLGCVEKDSASIMHITGYDNKRFSRVRSVAILNDTLAIASSGGLVIADVSYKDTDEITLQYHKADGSDKTSLSGNLLDYVYFDSRHRLWVCTENAGLNLCVSSSLLDSKLSFRHFGKGSGLPSTSYGITELNGSLVMTSIHSLSRIYFNDTLKGMDIMRLDKDYFGIELKFIEIPPVSTNQRKWIVATQTGALLLDLEEPTDKPSDSKIVITSLTAGSKSFEYGNIPYIIDISPNERSVKIGFAALDYRNPQDIRYWYRIVDTDQPAIALGHENSISLTDLLPGIHDIEITCAGNPVNERDRNSVRISLNIQPKFTETLWFKFILIILTTTVLAAIILTWSYASRMKKKHAEVTKAYLSLIGKKNLAQDMAVNVDIGRREDEFVRKLTAYISDKISDSDLKVENMAEHMAMSTSTLTRLTKSTMGITPGEFLSKARIRKAKMHLKTDPGLQIAEIAQLCGYSDPKYFSRCFKAETGMSPSQYRNNH